jgi:RimJ/RimL family protein N-acetyltransferase
MLIPFLVGERIVLRALEERDADGEYPSWLNDEEVSRGNAHHRHPYTRESARAYIQDARTSTDDLVLAIALKDSGRHIGNIMLKRINTAYRSAEFAILLGAKDLWGQGYSKEAGRLLCNHGFFTLDLRRIHCGTFESNVAMQKLAEYLGMRLEGRRRQAAFKDSRWLDVLEYGVLRDEYVEKFGDPSGPGEE